MIFSAYPYHLEDQLYVHTTICKYGLTTSVSPRILSLKLHTVTRLKSSFTKMAAQLFLGNIFAPTGILVDRSGNTYLNTDTGTGAILTKFSPNGSVLGQVSISSGFLDITSSVKLAIVSSGTNNETILALRPDGLILSINPNTLSVQTFLDLRSLNINASTVFDIATRSTVNLSGVIQTQSSTYGDIAINQSGNAIELYITGLSPAQTFPFVTRIQIQNNTIQSANVLMTSRADALAISPQTPRLERGIAVNNQGVVLTTLPIAIPPSGGGTPLQAFDVPVGFQTSFDPTNGVSQNEAPSILNNIDVYSQGMTSDASGNFYIATNSVGSAALGVPGQGALIEISPNLSRVIRAEGLGLTASTFRDVAINPINQQALVTVNTFSVGPVADDLVAAFLPNASTNSISSTSSSLGESVVQSVLNNMALVTQSNSYLSDETNSYNPTIIRPYLPPQNSSGESSISTLSSEAFINNQSSREILTTSNQGNEAPPELPSSGLKKNILEVNEESLFPTFQVRESSLSSLEINPQYLRPLPTRSCRPVF